MKVHSSAVSHWEGAYSVRRVFTGCLAGSDVTFALRMGVVKSPVCVPVRLGAAVGAQCTGSPKKENNNMIRSATAVWRGGPGAGEGSVITSSGVISALYSFASGFNEEPCTSSGEMLAAAQASCVSLMFTQELAKAGIRPQCVTTHADLKVQEVDGLWTITDIHL